MKSNILVAQNLKVFFSCSTLPINMTSTPAYLDNLLKTTHTALRLHTKLLIKYFSIKVTNLSLIKYLCKYSKKLFRQYLPTDEATTLNI